MAISHQGAWSAVGLSAFTAVLYYADQGDPAGFVLPVFLILFFMAASCGTGDQDDD